MALYPKLWNSDSRINYPSLYYILFYTAAYCFDPRCPLLIASTRNKICRRETWRHNDAEQLKNRISFQNFDDIGFLLFQFFSVWNLELYIDVLITYLSAIHIDIKPKTFDAFSRWHDDFNCSSSSGSMYIIYKVFKIPKITFTNVSNLQRR